MGLPGIPFQNIPEIYQDPNESTCVPVCIQVAFCIMTEKVSGIPELSLREISNKIGTNVDGTIPGKNIEDINEYLVSTTPHINVETQLGDIKWRSIKADIHEENPLNTPVIAVIAQYDSTELAWMPHAVVIVYAADDYTQYWDPFYGMISEPTNFFFQKWGQLDRFCIRFKIIPRTQTILEEYPTKIRSEEE